jgi:hypothetical protein
VGPLLVHARQLYTASGLQLCQSLMTCAGPPAHPREVPYVPHVGTDDLRPPISLPGISPEVGPEPGLGPGMPGGLSGRRGGGMHVGPGDPIFRGPPAGVFPGGDPGGFPGGFPGGPGFDPAGPGMPGGGLPPGARWDPINPPGMEVSSLLLHPRSPSYVLYHGSFCLQIAGLLAAAGWRGFVRSLALKLSP